MVQQWKKQASIAYGYSLVRLSLNYYGFLEERIETKECVKMKLIDECMDVIKTILDDNWNLETIKTLRSEIIEEMEILTAYADCFQVYEYALNRMERRFEKKSPLGLSDEECLQQLMKILMTDKEASTVNFNIQTIIGQLPIRFTRQKFYSMVREAMSIYIGSDESSLKGLLYQLRTTATVELSEAQKERYPEFVKQLEFLKELPWKTMTAKDYEAGLQEIAIAGKMLYDLSDTVGMLQDLINDCYVLALTDSDAVKDAREEVIGKEILKNLQQVAMSQDCTEMPTAITNQLCELEGVQESYYEKYQRLAPAPEYHNGEEQEAYFSRCVDKLLSASSFANLEETYQEKVVGKQDIDKACELFFTELDQVLTKTPKSVARAIMAGVLSSLPVCFNSIQDVEQYIKGSLESCSDEAEKDTCKELLMQALGNEDYEMV